MLTQLAEPERNLFDALHPQLLPAKTHPQSLLKMRRWRAVMPLAALLDHEGVMADICGITLSNSAPAPAGTGRARCHLAPARLMRWPPKVRQQLADLEARGALPLAAFREAQERRTPVRGRVRDIRRSVPDFSRLRQLLALLPDVVPDNHTGNPSVASASARPRRHVMDNAVPARAENVPLVNAPPVYLYPNNNAEPGPIRDRNDALTPCGGLSLV